MSRTAFDASGEHSKTGWGNFGPGCVDGELDGRERRGEGERGGVDDVHGRNLFHVGTGGSGAARAASGLKQVSAAAIGMKESADSPRRKACHLR